MSKLISLLMAASFSFLIFVGMTYLVKPKSQNIVEQPANPSIDFIFEDVDDPPNDRDRIIKQPEPPKEMPRVVTETATETDKPDVAVRWEMPKLHDAGKFGTLHLPNLMGGTSGAPGPKVRIHPRYPRDAAMNGIEGFVTLIFDITELGTTQNIRVVNAEPRGIFDREARRALKKWKYSPRVINERPVAQPGQQVTLEFHLEAS
ncbi:MAG: energy transducer TonB [Enterobacterales bacterium]|nr:energy transducer TonB [Enterobacterales bacterium]